MMEAERPFPERRRRWFRRFLPRSLLGRSLLIVLLPLVITEGIALEIYYGNSLHVVSRRLSDGVVGDITWTISLLERYRHPDDRAWILSEARRHTQLAMVWEPKVRLLRQGSTHVLGPMDEDLERAIQSQIGFPYFIDWMKDTHTVLISIQLGDGILEVGAPRKRLDVGQIWLFVAWGLGSSLLLFAIAGAVMRNQVKAIRRLSRAAEQFGLGRDTGPIRPEGAREVRLAAVAFNRMQERISRFVRQRTAVLAGVSHDLRTPLTRLRLSLAMLPQAGEVSGESLREDISDMEADVAEMERMIEGYLSFARGEGAEMPSVVDVQWLLEESALAAHRAGVSILGVYCLPGLTLQVRIDALRRVLGNLAENARRHGASVWFSAARDGGNVVIIVDDNGPGIAPEARDMVFRAFEKGQDGGAGLGLTIVRDIIRAHGGDVHLEESPHGGLRVRITLPS
ncbi:HAMP domain-containing protein [Acetobacter sp. AN02]|uniref:ATP-binding protein n=1 Tax=Acetobacter sp. AN02 TaxID=2894186 RepID=UPI00243425AC|nr:ATP-binding protein [Acetobacter sp. AN02]MDG6095357.1 HAMP domain-containing protein [Acetobacter sp. AN02]